MGRLLLRVSAVVVLFGCNSIVGIHDPKNDTEGGTGTGTGVDVSRFVGTWATTTGRKSIANCSLAGTASPISAVLHLTMGANGTIVVSPNQQTGCMVSLTVAGDVASLVPGQSCMFTDGNETDLYSYVAPTTFTLTDATHANAVITATVEVQPDNVSCDYQEQSVYTKQ